MGIINIGSSGFALSPNPPVAGVNLFSGADETAAEVARDSYFASNPDELLGYDGNTQKMIILLYGGSQYYQNRLNGVWVSSFNAATSSVDLSTQSVTDLSDITSAGRGAIITAEEATDIANAKSRLEDLTEVDNTSDVDKPISALTQTALDAKEDEIVAGTTNQYFRGDKSFQDLNKNAVGLAQVDNTSDVDKPVSTAVSNALADKQDTLVSGINLKTINGESLLGNTNISVGLDERVDWVLSTDVFTTPIIAYANLHMQVNSSGDVPVYILGGSEPVQSYRVSSGSLPAEVTLDTNTGTLSYTTTASTSSGSFGITANNPVGDSAEFIVNWEISAPNGIAEFSNSENVYPFLRVTTSNSDSNQFLIKNSFYGTLTSTSSGVINEDSTYPIYTASNGDNTWNYLIKPDSSSYWYFYKNSTTDPATLSNGLSTDIRTSGLTYDLVSPASQDVLVGGVNFPSDRSDVHWGSGINYIEIGNDASLNGVMTRDDSWSFGFTLVDAWKPDGMGRGLLTREGRNWLAMAFGHSGTYSELVYGNGSSRTYHSSESTSLPAGGFPAGAVVRVTFDGSATKFYVDGTMYYNATSSSIYWDGSSADALSLQFSNGVNANANMTSDSYEHSKWQGQISRLWIAAGTVESTDDNGTAYPAGATHAWDLSETTGAGFAASIGSITAQGIKG